VVGSMLISEEVKSNIWNDFYRKWISSLHAQMDYNKEKLTHWYFFTGNASVPKSLIEKAGLFDESFKCYGSEDSELGYRLWKDGVKIIYESKAKAEHFNEENLRSILGKRESWGKCHLLLAKKHPELAKEVSVAGVLAPGRKYYQIFIKKSFLLLGKSICIVLAILNLNGPCLFFLRRLSLAYYAFGMVEALNIYSSKSDS
jgi:GT2 family glycosyltransferase